MPAISVLLSSYNDDPAFLDASIASILAQTERDYEFLIVDDHSQEATLACLRKWAAKDPRIRLIENPERLGFSPSLNLGIQAAKAPYIARMDSDDLSLPTRFAIEKQYLDTHPEVAVVGCSAVYFDENGPWGVAYPRAKIDLKGAFLGDGFIHPSVMMRKDALLSVGGYTVFAGGIRTAEDYDLWLKLAQKGYGLVNLPDLLFKYREGSEAYKKRKMKYQRYSYSLKRLWRKRLHYSWTYDVHFLKLFMIGLLPKGLYKKMHRKTLIKNAESVDLEAFR